MAFAKIFGVCINWFPYKEIWMSSKLFYYLGSDNNHVVFRPAISFNSDFIPFPSLTREEKLQRRLAGHNRCRRKTQLEDASSELLFPRNQEKRSRNLDSVILLPMFSTLARYACCLLDNQSVTYSVIFCFIF